MTINNSSFWKFLIYVGFTPGHMWSKVTYRGRGYKSNGW